MDIIESFLNTQSKTEVLETLKKYCNEVGFDNFIYTPLLVGGDSVCVFKDESKIFEAKAIIVKNIISNSQILGRSVIKNRNMNIKTQ